MRVPFPGEPQTVARKAARNFSTSVRGTRHLHFHDALTHVSLTGSAGYTRPLCVVFGSARARGVCFARIHLRGGGEGLFCLRGINVATAFTTNSPRLRRNSRVLFSDSLSIVRSLLSTPRLSKEFPGKPRCRSPPESSGMGMNDDEGAPGGSFLPSSRVSTVALNFLAGIVRPGQWRRKFYFASAKVARISRFLIWFHSTAGHYYCWRLLLDLEVETKVNFETLDVSVGRRSKFDRIRKFPWILWNENECFTELKCMYIHLRFEKRKHFLRSKTFVCQKISQYPN